MRRWALILAFAAVGCGGCGKKGASKGDAMASYVTDYASAGRSSRVEAGVRAYGALVRLADPTEEPWFVHTDPSGSRLVVRYKRHLDLIEGAAVKRRFATAPPTGDSMVLAQSWGVVYGGAETNWDGTKRESPFDTNLTQEGYQIAARLDGDHWTTISQDIASFHMQQSITVSSMKGSPRTRAETDPLWGARHDGNGTGCITRDGRVAVAMQTGKITLYDARGNPETNDGVILAQRELGEEAYQISAFQPGFAVFTVKEIPNADASQPADRNYRFQAPRGWAFKLRWATRVHALDDALKDVWVAEVPFEARQPPVDGGAGRVYLVGMGIAAVERGGVVWSTRSEVPMAATAFADGALAVVVGPLLRIVGRDGAVVQELRSAEGETFTTPPAIAPDGSVFVGSAKHIYVAK